MRRRVMDLRVILDKGAAGNTCCIVKAHLFKSARKDALSCVPAQLPPGRTKKILVKRAQMCDNKSAEEV